MVRHLRGRSETRGPASPRPEVRSPGLSHSAPPEGGTTSGRNTWSGISEAGRAGLSVRRGSPTPPTPTTEGLLRLQRSIGGPGGSVGRSAATSPVIGDNSARSGDRHKKSVQSRGSTTRIPVGSHHTVRQHFCKLEFSPPLPRNAFKATKKLAGEARSLCFQYLPTLYPLCRGEGRSKHGLPKPISATDWPKKVTPIPPQGNATSTTWTRKKATPIPP